MTGPQFRRLVPALLFALLLALCAGMAAATQPLMPDDVLWSRELGGPGDQKAYSFVATADGGFAAAGSTLVAGNEQAYLIKADGRGYREWNRSYGNGIISTVYDLRQTADGGYVLAGFVLPDQAQAREAVSALAIGTDAAGAPRWSATFGDMHGDIFTAVLPEDPGFSFAGINGSATLGLNAYLVSVDPTGEKTRELTFGNATGEQAYDARRTADGGYVLAGSTRAGHFDRDEAYLLKVGGDGLEQWHRSLNPAIDSYAESVALAPDGGYALAGTVRNGSSYAFYLVRTDLNGTKLWDKAYDGEGDGHAKCVVPTPDGGYLLVGTQGPEGSTDARAIKVDSAGELQWDRTFSAAAGDLALLRALPVADGGYVCAGYALTRDNAYDVWIVKLRGEPGYQASSSPTPSITSVMPTPAASALASPTLVPAQKGFCGSLFVLPVLLIGVTYLAVRRKRV